ncbi:MAG: hypothetical protein ABFS02_02700 [Pseudomonadota bacterium]
MKAISLIAMREWPLSYPGKTASFPYIVIFYAGLLGCYYTFSQGISGSFLFDDANNLAGLTKLKEGFSAAEFWHYTLSGFSGPLGRPLSLATFAAQFAQWPQHPEAFKQVNILLHLLNGTILFWVLISLRPFFRNQSRQSVYLVASVSTVAWLIHPLQISTVLYVVQRMTELSTLFILLGILTYLFARHWLLKQDHRPIKYLSLSIGFGICILLGILSKENAILLPLLILVLEASLLKHVSRPRYYYIWASTFLFLPLFILILYLYLNVSGASYATRDFTVYERLLTEPRIIFDYLAKILLINTHDIGKLFNNFRHSTAIYSPPTTAIAIIGAIALFTGGLLSRKKHPFLSFGILWFFASHSLESTVIPLELYFEHRNYLASIGPIVSLAYYATVLVRYAHSNIIRNAIVTGLIAYLSLLAMLTFQIASIWGKPLEQAAIWIKEQPTLKRTRNYYAYLLLKNNFPIKAAEEYYRISAIWPNDPAFLLAIVEINCLYPGINAPNLDNVISLLKGKGGNPLLDIYFLDRLISEKEQGYCNHYSPKQLNSMIKTARSNGFYSSQAYNLLLLSSRTAILSGNKAAAYAYLVEAVTIRPEINLVFQLIVWDLEDNNLPSALHHFNIIETDTRISMIQHWSYRESIKQVQNYLRRNSVLRNLDP